MDNNVGSIPGPSKLGSAFPKLKPGKYFLKGTRRETGTDGVKFRVSTDTVLVSVSSKKSDAIACFVAEAEADSC